MVLCSDGASCVLWFAAQLYAARPIWRDSGTATGGRSTTGHSTKGEWPLVELYPDVKTAASCCTSRGSDVMVCGMGRQEVLSEDSNSTGDWNIGRQE
jgi:hypothetical protein